MGEESRIKVPMEVQMSNWKRNLKKEQRVEFTFLPWRPPEVGTIIAVVPGPPHGVPWTTYKISTTEDRSGYYIVNEKDILRVVEGGTNGS